MTVGTDRTEVLSQVLSGREATPDELPRLFEEFSRVTSDLMRSHEVLLGQVEAMKTELAAKNRELERKKRLEALGRVAAGVAHEFRNPLGGIRLTVDALLRDRPAKRARDRLEHVAHAVGHLDHIVEEMLTFTRGELPDLERRRVRELVEDALGLALADRPEVRARWLIDGPETMELSVDPRSFSQVLINLVVNATQATAEPGRMGVWWGERDGQSWIEVADEGDGIPLGEEERIFHPFHTLRDHGTGLGLAIVHSRIEAHRGEIAVVNDAWGGEPLWSGARFRILLPAPINEQDTP